MALVPGYTHPPLNLPYPTNSTTNTTTKCLPGCHSYKWAPEHHEHIKRAITKHIHVLNQCWLDVTLENIWFTHVMTA